MTYYEELGVSAAAPDEDIRKAHRTLSKLLHPDQQLDPVVRQAAEIQMMRLNGIVAVLLDPDQRKCYNESLIKPKSVAGVHRGWWAGVLVKIPLSGSAWGFLATVAAAVLLTLGAVWFYAGDLMHFGAVPGDALPAPKAAITRTERVRERTSSIPAKRSVKSPVASNSRFAPGIASGAIEPVVSPPIAAKPDSAPLLSPKIDAPPLTFAAPPLVQPAAPEPMLAGLWVFASAAHKSEGAKTALYAPEFIELHLRSVENTMYGQYDSRYKVADRAISPHVRFVFHGPSAPVAAFDWNSEDGSRGTVELKLLTAQSLQVNWKVTEFGSRIGLGAGTAVLIRKSDP